MAAKLSLWYVFLGKCGSVSLLVHCRERQATSRRRVELSHCRLSLGRHRITISEACRSTQTSKRWRVSHHLRKRCCGKFLLARSSGCLQRGSRAGLCTRLAHCAFVPPWFGPGRQALSGPPFPRRFGRGAHHPRRMSGVPGCSWLLKRMEKIKKEKHGARFGHHREIAGCSKNCGTEQYGR